MSTSPRRPPSWKPLAEALLGGAEFTPGEVADIAGVSIEHARRLWQGLGFPPVADDERAFTRADAEILRAVRHLSETQGAVPADQLTLTRVIGQAMERVADAQVSIAAARLNWLDAEAVWNDASVAALASGSRPWHRAWSSSSVTCGGAISSRPCCALRQCLRRPSAR
jgi:adenylate cyclase